MGESKYNNFIQQYETVRKVLKDMYVFGCYKNTIYEKKLGIKLKTYEKELQRLQFYIDEDFRNENRYGHWKIYGFKYDRYKNVANYLAGSYKLKSYTSDYMILHFNILQVLYQAAGPMSRKEIADAIIKSRTTNLFSGDSIDEKEVLRKLEEMIEQGLVSSINIGIKRKYQLFQNPFHNLTIEELKELYLAVDFY